MSIARIGTRIVFAALPLVVGCEDTSQPLTLMVATEEPAPSIASALVPLLDERGIEVEVLSEDDATRILSLIASGEADLAIVEEPPAAVPGVSTVLPLYPSVLHVLYRAGRDPGSFADVIREQAVYAGPAGGVGRRALERFAHEFGVGDDEFTTLENPWTRSPDVYFIFGGLLGDENLPALRDYRLYSFGSAERLGRGILAEGLALKHPELDVFVLPERIYQSLNEDAVVTLVGRSVLVARSGLAAPLTYDIAETLLMRPQRLAAVYPLVPEALNEDFETAELALPLHPGAMRYINKDEPGFLQLYAETIALMLTALTALFSGAVAFYRYNRNRRKNRVDEFYQRVLDSRAEIVQGMTGERAKELSAEVREMQRDVIALLADERVDADDGLRIFFDLSNQVLAELEAPVRG